MKILWRHYWKVTGFFCMDFLQFLRLTNTCVRKKKSPVKIMYLKRWYGAKSWKNKSLKFGILIKKLNQPKTEYSQHTGSLFRILRSEKSWMKLFVDETVCREKCSETKWVFRWDFGIIIVCGILLIVGCNMNFKQFICNDAINDFLKDWPSFK